MEQSSSAQDTSIPSEGSLPQGTWRTTQDFSIFPVQGFRQSLMELEKDKLKNFNEEVIVIQDKINPKVVKFPTKSSVFHREHGYMEVKKVLQNGAKYQLAFKAKDKKDREAIQVSGDEVSVYFTIKFVIASQKGK